MYARLENASQFNLLDVISFNDCSLSTLWKVKMPAKFDGKLTGLSKP